jgi:hypothetical protein
MRIERVSALGAILLSATTALIASATPNPNSAVIIERVFNDCPFSVLTTNNSYPSLISFSDNVEGCGTFANLHVWRFSEDGATPAIFMNADCFTFRADLVISGTGQSEAGLQIRPWWSEADGRVNVRTTDGEIACFGGRLPFFSFTATYGITYVKGEPISIEVAYDPNGLTADDPGTIVYTIDYMGTEYSSGVLSFDEGNGAEGYGTWGILDQAQVGAFHQVFTAAQGVATAEWRNIEFEPCGPTPTIDSSWGSIKANYKSE